MSLLAIAWKSLRQRALSSFLTALSVALGVGMMVTVLVIHGTISNMFQQSATSFELIIGAKGSPLQLVLNTIYLMEKPIENIPYKQYKSLKKLPDVAAAIPIAMGDTTEDGRFRIVGTVPEFFDSEILVGRKFAFAQGKVLSGPFDAVVGSRAAEQLGWKLGHEFKIAHGGNVNDVHSQIFKVSGILARSGSAFDRAVFVDLEDFYRIPGHEKPLSEAMEKDRAIAAAAGQDPSKVTGPNAADPAAGLLDEQKEVTSILLQMKRNPDRPTSATLKAVLLAGIINDRPVAQAVNPADQVNRLLRDVVGPVRTALFVMTVMIVIVSTVGVFVSIYNSMSERRREIAIMRALGAGRGTVLSIIVLEAILVCVLGGIAGFLLGHGLVFLAAPVVEARSDVLMNPWMVVSQEQYIMPVLLMLAILAGLVPGISAYRTDVARNLSG